MKVLIAGATGLVGGELLRLLIEDQAVEEIHMLSRRPIEEASSKIKIHLAELGDHWLDSLQGMRFDAVYCCLGTTMKIAGSQEAFRAVDQKAVIQLARFAKESGSGFFGMVSSVGADSRSRSFYLRVKGETEDAVRALSLPRLAILNPSVLLGERNAFRLADAIGGRAMKVLNPLLVGSLRKYRGVEAREVARELWSCSQNEKK